MSVMFSVIRGGKFCSEIREMDHQFGLRRASNPRQRGRERPATLRALAGLCSCAALLATLSFAVPAPGTINALAAERSASPQPTPPVSVSHEVIPPTAADALRRLATSYRSGLFAERVTFAIDDDPPAADLDRAVLVRILAGVAPQRQDRTVRIDLPDLAVHAVAGRIVATRPSDPTGFIDWPIDGPPTLTALESILPPLALPQLALALGEDTLARPTPFGAVDSWEMNAPTQPEQGTLVRLIGTGPTAITELVFNAITDRLSEFTIRPAPGRTGITVRARCETIAPGPVKSWAVSVEGRRRVPTFDDLHAPQNELKVGDVLPDLSFQDRQQARWSMTESLASANATDLGLVLLFRPAPTGDGAIAPDVVAGIHAMQRAWRRSVLRSAERQSEPSGRGTPDSKLLFARGVAVFDLEAFTRDRLERLHGTWAASLTSATSGLNPSVRPPPDVASLLWTPTGTSSLDRLAPDARAVLLVIGADRTIRAMVRLDGRASDEAAINGELDNAAR